MNGERTLTGEEWAEVGRLVAKELKGLRGVLDLGLEPETLEMLGARLPSLGVLESLERKAREEVAA